LRKRELKDIKKAILDFVEREYELPADIDYESFNYMDAGYVDSMGLVQFVAILEDEFDIEFSAEELKSEDFKTLGGLEAIIRNKL